MISPFYQRASQLTFRPGSVQVPSFAKPDEIVPSESGECFDCCGTQVNWN